MNIRTHGAARHSVMLLLLQGILLCTACGNDDSNTSSGSPEACESNNDCLNGYYCDSNRCVKSSDPDINNPSPSNYCSSASSDSTCQRCVKSHCCPEYQACGDSGQCTGIAKCVGSCSSDSCYETCEEDYPNGVTPFLDLAYCMSDYCESACS